MIVIIFVDVHDLQLYVCHQIGDRNTGDHCGNNGFALFPPNVKAAVNGMHRNCHCCKGEQRCGQRTVYISKENVVERQAKEKRKSQNNIKHDRHNADQDICFHLMK